MSTTTETLSYHAGAQAAFDTVASPRTMSEVGPAQIAVRAIWYERGGYGCEQHLLRAAMARVSRLVFPFDPVGAAEQMAWVERTGTRCLSCQYEEAVLNRTATREQVNHWTMWGCTCDPVASAEAEEFYELVSD